MTPLEQLLAIADAETLVLARKLIGREQLAILIAKAVLDGTTIKIRPTDVANILEMPTSTASAALSTGRGSKSRQ